MRQILHKASFVIVASGRGLRVGGDRPKQYIGVGGKPLIAYALNAALSHPLIGLVALVIHPDDQAHLEEAMISLSSAKALHQLIVTHGGAQRQQSVLNGLEALAGRNVSGPVLVHDAARPFLSESLITRAVAGAIEHKAAVPVLPIVDTVKRVDDNGRIEETLDRSALRTVQTPQAFDFTCLLTAHRDAAAVGLTTFPDDASLMEWAGFAVETFEGDRTAFKVTLPADIAEAEAYLERMAKGVSKGVTKVCTGYDVHALGEGNHVWLGGLKITHSKGLIGHSDADPVLHALTDAIMGTIADGDIGSHFPPSDPKWEGAASHIFLRYAVDLLHAKGGRLIHLDATIICEEPKIGPHREAMRTVIADIVGLDRSDVSVKATTSEQLGFTGRREGIAAIGTVTAQL